MMGVYGQLDPTYHIKFWKLIFLLGKNIDQPWVVLGDYNEILHVAKKWGGRARSENQMGNFWDVLVACDLRDLG